MSVTLTPAAAKHVNRYLTKRGKGVGVRLGVKTTGCSGLAYKLEYVDELSPEDVVYPASASCERFARVTTPLTVTIGKLSLDHVVVLRQNLYP